MPRWSDLTVGDRGFLVTGLSDPALGWATCLWFVFQIIDSLVPIDEGCRYTIAIRFAENDLINSKLSSYLPIQTPVTHKHSTLNVFNGSTTTIPDHQLPYPYIYRRLRAAPFGKDTYPCTILPAVPINADGPAGALVVWRQEKSVRMAIPALA